MVDLIKVDIPTKDMEHLLSEKMGREVKIISVYREAERNIRFLVVEKKGE